MNRSCSKCHRVLTLDSFSIRKDTKSGLASHCKDCCNDKRRLDYLKNKTTRPKSHNQRVKRYRDKNYMSTWAHSTMSGHRYTGFTLSFTSKELVELAKISPRCTICDTELSWEPNKGKSQHNSPSIDRVDNKSGDLTISDINIVCHKCNTTKQNRTQQEFIDYCSMIHNKHSGCNSGSLQLNPDFSITEL